MEKVFRDPVHGLMHFNVDQDRLVLDLLDTAEVQRLRHIRQMGLSDFVFPGATHTSFSHSLGVVHLMKRALGHFAQLGEETLGADIVDSLAEHRDLLLATALIHDIGHFPFSHLMEEVLGLSHETWSVKLALDPQSGVHRVLAKKKAALPNQVAAVLQRTFKPSYVVKLVSSQLDVDRMDYLLRDSLYTGVGYGKFDLDWLLHSLRIVPHRGDHVVAVDARKGLQVAESYVLARYYMYQQVYHHKMERAAGAMLLHLLNRARTLMQNNRVRHMPAPLGALLSEPEAIDRATFMSLTDVTVMDAIMRWRGEADGVLADLAARLLQRRIFKSASLTCDQFELLKTQIYELAGQKGVDAAHYVHFDSAVDNPYKDPYLEPSHAASVRIYLCEADGALSDLAQQSAIIQAIRNRSISLERLCYPAELRPELPRLLDHASEAHAA